LRSVGREEACIFLLYIVLVSDQQITVRTIAARLVQREQVHRVHMDDLRQFLLMHLAIALWANRKTGAPIRIKEEAVLRWLFTKLYPCLILPLYHCCLVTL